MTRTSLNRTTAAQETILKLLTCRNSTVSLGKAHRRRSSWSAAAAAPTPVKRAQAAASARPLSYNDCNASSDAGTSAHERRVENGISAHEVSKQSGETCTPCSSLWVFGHMIHIHCHLGGHSLTVLDCIAKITGTVHKASLQSKRPLVSALHEFMSKGQPPRTIPDRVTVHRPYTFLFGQDTAASKQG